MDPVEQNKDRRIPKRFLEHGHYYAGMCRNASLARWDATTQQFFHWRVKFGNRFIESIKCFEDDERYDVFLPFVDITEDFNSPIALPGEEGADLPQ